MRIGIDARFYAEAGGLGRYTRELIGELEKIDDKNEYLIFVTLQGGELYQPQNARFKKIIVNIRWYSWQEQIWWPLILNKQKIDLMHFLHWNVPCLYKAFLTISLICCIFQIAARPLCQPLFIGRSIGRIG